MGERAAVALLIVLLTAGCAGAPAQAGPAPTDRQVLLPDPTGQYPVGTTRRPVVTADRELMVQYWYPAQEGAAEELAPYAPPGEAAALAGVYPVPEGAFTPAVTGSRSDAAPADGSFPLVLVSHGLCGALTDLTGLSQELASRGYVVASVGHTGEAFGVEFPDGRVVGNDDPQHRCVSDPDTPEIAAQQDVRTRDLQRTLDAIPADLPVDPARVAAVGHSFGGSTALNALADPRVDAAVDLDGFLAGPVRGTGSTKPTLLLGSAGHDGAADPTWADGVPRLTGWSRWFEVTGAGHYRFIDVGTSTGRWGLDQSLRAQDPGTWNAMFGDVDPVRTFHVVADLTGAFLDQHLRGEPQPVLDTPPAEVRLRREVG
jgi:dienelactone hydrolase